MFHIVDSEFGEAIQFMDSQGVIWTVAQDLANTDYQAYLSWVAEGNTALPWPT